MIRYGFIMEDTKNKKIALHPLIQEVVLLETMPSVSNCKSMINSLHLICLAHGLDARKPQNIISSLISICDHIINDMPEYYLLYLQDTFPYFDKYLVTDIQKPPVSTYIICTAGGKNRSWRKGISRNY